MFGIQADELWSFVQDKFQKRWVWVAYDPVHRLVVAYHIGGRGEDAAKQFWNKSYIDSKMIDPRTKKD